MISCTPRKLLINLPEYLSQILIVLSAEPETILFPSGEKHTQLTFFTCPFKFLINVPYKSQILIVFKEPETTLFPSGEKITQLIKSVSNIFYINLPVNLFKILIILFEIIAI